MTILTEPEPGWNEAREIVWQEMRTVLFLGSMRYASRVDLSMRFHTAQGDRHLIRVEGGWSVSEYATAQRWG